MAEPSEEVTRIEIESLKIQVLQYKKKCGDLEEELADMKEVADRSQAAMDEKADSFRQRLDSTEARLRRSEQHHTSDIEDALLRLEEERKRAESLAEVNAMLRDQLATANEGNENLTADLKKVTDDLQKCQTDFEDVQEKLKTTEEQWKEEQENFSTYFGKKNKKTSAHTSVTNTADYWRCGEQLYRSEGDSPISSPALNLI